MYFVQLRIAPQNPKTPILYLRNYIIIKYKIGQMNNFRKDLE